MWNALKWVEPEKGAGTRKVDRMHTEYRDMFLRKAEYWSRVERDKENARQANSRDEGDRWGTENRDKYRTFVPSPEGGPLLPDNELECDPDAHAILEVVSPETAELVDPQQQQQPDASAAAILPADKKQVRINYDETKSALSGRTAQTAKSSKKKMTPAQKKAQKELKKRKSEFDNTTRWLPDSAFQTYFGIPAFHLYGRANVNPAVGGINYGENMLTHNINAESGANPPLYQQVYD